MADVSSPALVPDRAGLARHRVRDRIERLILNGELSHGTRLIQQRLAKRFGVAQSVVREALLDLKGSGLVHAVDNLGMSVSSLDADRIDEAYELREVLEGLAARLCCQRASRADLRELEEMVGRMHELSSNGEFDDAGRLDREFHLRLTRLSGNRTLAWLTDTYRVLGKFIGSGQRAGTSRREHLAILEAIRSDRADDAERLARTHVSDGRRDILARIAGGTLSPKWIHGDGQLLSPSLGKGTAT